MHPAQFKTTRERLGLSAQWVADSLGVTIQRIYLVEASNRPIPVPERHAEYLLGLERDFEAEVARAVKSHKKGEPVSRYRNVDEWHAAHPLLSAWPASSQGMFSSAVAERVGESVSYV